MPSPSIPSRAHCARARVGPRSGPPCFFDPPTKVGAIASARRRHFEAPRQPREAIRSPIASPTEGGSHSPRAGQMNASGIAPLNATRMNRGRSCGTPNHDALTTLYSVSYPSPASFRISPRRYGANFSEARPGTFSSRTARGRISPTNRSASGKRSRSSFSPSCLPAMENGGQGTPPARRSTPLNGVPSNVVTEPS